MTKRRSRNRTPLDHPDENDPFDDFADGLALPDADSSAEDKPSSKSRGPKKRRIKLGLHKKPKNNKEPDKGAKTRERARPSPNFEVRDIEVNKIRVKGNRRQLDPKKVEEITDSINEIGLRTPITVRGHLRGPILVAGLHRLEAAKLLGWKTIPCVYIGGGERVARLWEISENLHRAELSAMDRAKLVAEWVQLINERESNSSKKLTRSKQGRPEGGIARAARELPVKGKTPEARRKAIERDMKAAKISQEAEEVIREAGLEDNQSALTAIAAEATPDAQVKKAKDLAARRRAPRSKRGPCVAEDAYKTLNFEWRLASGFRHAWKNATPEERTRFLKEVMKHPDQAVSKRPRK